MVGLSERRMRIGREVDAGFADLLNVAVLGDRMTDYALQMAYRNFTAALLHIGGGFIGSLSLSLRWQAGVVGLITRSSVPGQNVYYNVSLGFCAGRDTPKNSCP